MARRASKSKMTGSGAASKTAGDVKTPLTTSIGARVGKRAKSGRSGRR